MPASSDDTATLDATGAALLAGVLADPADDHARLVFADWLEENGQEERAEFIRVQCELHERVPVWSVPAGAMIRYTRVNDRDLYAALFDSSKCPSFSPRDFLRFFGEPEDRGRQIGAVGIRDDGTEIEFDVPTYLPPNTIDAVRATDLREIAGRHYRAHYSDWFPDPTNLLRLQPMWVDGRVTRGFVESITCTAADWLAHADALFWHPRQTVPCPAKGCEGGTIGRPRPGAIGGQWMGRMCNHCEGMGTVPRPMPPTAHPITKVVLTTLPEFVRPENALRDVYQLRGRQNAYIVPPGEYIPPYLLHKEWPGIEFELPRESYWPHT